MYRSILLLCTLVVLARAYPATPPAQICGNTALLAGPATPPAGAIIVSAGLNGMHQSQALESVSWNIRLTLTLLEHIDNANIDFTVLGATYWFAPGVHYFAASPFGQIIPNNHSRFIGGPGAIIDGNNTNLYAFTQGAVNVTIKYLEIRNFGYNSANGRPSNNNEATINGANGANWTIEYNNIHHNDGAAIFVGTNSVTRFNCFKDNGQYAFGSYHPDGVRNVLVENNEIVGNNRDDWEYWEPGCGCTGGGKFWTTKGAIIRNNWVHDNFGPGLWVDHNNADFLFENNWFEGNEGMGIFYEVSYNFIIRNNVFKRNSIANGLKRLASGNPFPEGAIYISESGSDTRAPGPGLQSEIVGNLFVNNWDGVILWEGADRFCRPNETFDTSNGCPWFNETWGERQRTQNVKVYLNEFKFNASEIGCTNPVFCGRNGIFSSTGSYAMYPGNTIQLAVTFNQNNKFANNSYTGPWAFLTKSSDNNIPYGFWHAAPYNQDVGSTYTSPTTTPTPSGQPVANYLNADTSTAEGSVGMWASWYSASVAQSSVAKTGSKSIQVTVTNSWGYGITLSNYPGFPITPGAKRVSLWVKLVTGTNVPLTLTIQWFNSSDALLQTNQVTSASIPTTWTNVQSTVTAPAGTAFFLLKLTGSDVVNTSYLMDDIVVGDQV
eukprot:gene8151-9571_t